MKVRIPGIKFGRFYLDKESNRVIQEIIIKNKFIATIGILWWLFKRKIRKK